MVCFLGDEWPLRDGGVVVGVAGVVDLIGRGDFCFEGVVVFLAGVARLEVDLVGVVDSRVPEVCDLPGWRRMIDSVGLSSGDGRDAMRKGVLGFGGDGMIFS